MTTQIKIKLKTQPDIYTVMGSHPFVRGEFEKLCSLSDPNDLSIKFLNKLFVLYDQSIFEQMISRKIKSMDLEMVCRISSKMTSSAGNFVIKDGSCVISLSKPVMQQIDPRHLTTGYFRSSGLLISSLLQAVMITFEHELTHLIVRLFTEEVDCSHGPIFKMICAHFGHTSITHDLFAPQKPISTNLSSHHKKVEPCLRTFNVGEQVTYRSSKLVEIKGTIVKVSRVNVRVLCEDRSIYIIRKSVL
jgi:hypothetical protein